MSNPKTSIQRTGEHPQHPQPMDTDPTAPVETGGEPEAGREAATGTETPQISRVVLPSAGGAMDIFKALNIKEVSPEDYISKEFNEPVVCRLDPWHYAQPRDGKPFDWQHWVESPMEHVSTFLPYAKVTDMFVACHYWDFRSPHFFRLEDMQHPDFKIKVIADVSCDVPGPIPSTLRATTIAEPFYDYNPELDREEPAFSNEKNITMMTVDNLPGELPRDASEDFGKTLITMVIPHFLGNDEEGVIERATIVKDGKLTERYQYLQAYLEGKE